MGLKEKTQTLGCSWPPLRSPIERRDMTAPDSQLCHG